MVARNCLALTVVLAAAQVCAAQVGPYASDGAFEPPIQGFVDGFGRAIAMFGDTCVVGAESADELPGSGTEGAAYVYVRTEAGWLLQATLTASDGSAIDLFGEAVAIEGDTILVGAPGDDLVPGHDADGSVYVFERIFGSWAQVQKIPNPDPSDDDNYGAAFGTAVALTSTTAVIGADSDDVVPGGIANQAGRGSAYVFVRNETGWQEQAKLTASDAEDVDYFGFAVAIDGDTVVVGRRPTVSNGHDKFAYVFERTLDEWSEVAKLATDPSNVFAGSIAVSGDVLIARASGHTAQAYRRVDGEWLDDGALVMTPTPPLTGGGGLFVALQEDVAVLGRAEGLTDDGVACVFRREALDWEQLAALQEPDAVTPDGFGTAVTIHENRFIVACRRISGSATIGEVFAYELLPIGAWEDLGRGLVGSAGIPVMEGVGYLQATAPTTLSLSLARPFSLAPLVVGITVLNAPFKGGVLVPNPDLIFPLFTDFFGEASFGGAWPAGVPSGFTSYFQWWIEDPAGVQGYAASNALAGTTQ